MYAVHVTVRPEGIHKLEEQLRSHGSDRVVIDAKPRHVLVVPHVLANDLQPDQTSATGKVESNGKADSPMGGILTKAFRSSRLLWLKLRSVNLLRQMRAHVNCVHHCSRSQMKLAGRTKAYVLLNSSIPAQRSKDLLPPTPFQAKLSVCSDELNCRAIPKLAAPFPRMAFHDLQGHPCKKRASGASKAKNKISDGWFAARASHIQFFQTLVCQESIPDLLRTQRCNVVVAHLQMHQAWCLFQGHGPCQLTRAASQKHVNRMDMTSPACMKSLTSESESLLPATPEKTL